MKSEEKRTKQVLFKMSQSEYDRFEKEAKKRFMGKSELLRYLIQRLFEKKFKW